MGWLSIAMIETNGCRHDLEVPPQSTVLRVKKLAALVVRIPAAFQSLVVDGTALPDEADICSFRNHAQARLPLEVTLLFMPPLLAFTASSAPYDRLMAIDSLREVAYLGRSEVLETLLDLTKDTDTNCRLAVVAALATAAPILCHRCIEALGGLLLDNDRFVVSSTIDALGKAAASGNSAAQILLLEFWEGAEDLDDEHVVLAAVQACAKLPAAYHCRVAGI